MDVLLIVQFVTLHHYIMHYDVCISLFSFCSTWRFFCLTNMVNYSPESRLSGHTGKQGTSILEGPQWDTRKTIKLGSQCESSGTLEKRQNWNLGIMINVCYIQRNIVHQKNMFIRRFLFGDYYFSQLGMLFPKAFILNMFIVNL